MANAPGRSDREGTKKGLTTWSRLTHINVARTQSGHLILSLEATASDKSTPQQFESFLTPEQAIELGMALQETGRQCLLAKPTGDH